MIYRDGDKLVKDTGKAPRQFSGILSIVYAGISPETLEEAIYPTDQLRALPTVVPTDLSSEWQVALGLPVVASKPTHDKRPSPPRRHQRRSERAVSRHYEEQDVPDWRAEYKEAMVGIWSGWAFIVTPMILVWVPFTIVATILWSVAALYALCEEYSNLQTEKPNAT